MVWDDQDFYVLEISHAKISLIKNGSIMWSFDKNGQVFADTIVARHKDWIPVTELKTLFANANDFTALKAAIAAL